MGWGIGHLAPNTPKIAQIPEGSKTGVASHSTREIMIIIFVIIIMSTGMVEVLVCCLSLYTEYLNCEVKQQMVYQPSMVTRATL